MIRIFKISLLIILIFISGCAKSIISLALSDDKKAIPMFGKIPSRDFYYDVNMSDSLKLVWENSTYGGFNNSSPVVYDSMLFIGDLGGRIYCFDSRSGNQIGLLRTKGSIYSSPIVFKNKIIYALCEANSENTYLVYYDFLNSVERASIIIEGLVLSQMLKDKNDIILCTENGKIMKYTSEGKLVWDIASNSKIQSNPALIGNKIIVGNNIGEILFADSETGKLIKKIKMGSAFYSGVTVDSNTAYIGDDNGTLYAINVNDEKLIWEFKTGYRILMNPAVDDEFVYIGNLKGDLYALNKQSGKLIWKSEIGGILNSTPLITKNRIVINNLLQSFFILDKKDGEINKKIELDGRGKLSPILINNKIIIGYDDGNLSAYEIVF